MKRLSRFRYCIIGALITACVGQANEISENEVAGDVEFAYGIVGRTHQNADSLIQVRDNDILKSGDQIKIMFNRALDSFFYVILHMSNGDYSIFYTSKPDQESPTETMKLESLEWLQLDEEPGTETVLLISSREKLMDLENSFIEYGAARGDERHIHEDRIRGMLTTYMEQGADTVISEIALLAPVDKRTNIGRIYRGPYDENNQQQYLFSRCSGSDVAGDMIRIIHR